MLPTVNVGDTVLHPQVFSLGDRAWRRKYEILHVTPSTRFDKPDMLLRAKISCVDVHTGVERLTDTDRVLWLSQLSEAL